MDDLARVAKLSRATLYRRAGSREAVLDALRGGGTAIPERTDTRERILAAARTVFCRAGFDAATIDEIAVEAGVGLATVYRHFGDKDRLVAGFLDRLGPRRAARDASAKPTGDLRHDLEQLATRVLVGVRDDGAIIRLMILESLRGSELLPRVRAQSPVRTLSAIAALLRPHAEAGRLRSRDVDALAQSFSGLLAAFGIIGPILGGRPVVDPEATAREITEQFLHGAMAHREKPR